MKRSAPLAASLLALAALALPAAGRADWLVTAEGARVETRGPWEVKGKLFVFTAADGTLASLRAAQIDLDASRRATAEAKEALADAAEAPAPASAPAPRKAVRSITDKDFRHPDDEAGDAPAGDASAPKAPAVAGAAAPAGRSPVSVATWQKVDRAEKDGVDLAGTLQNKGGDLQTDVALSITVVDDEGGVLGTARAVLGTDSIPAQGTTDFKASFPGVFTFARAKFDIQSAGLKMTLAPASAPADKAH